MNLLFPMFVNLNKKLCVVVGGGNVALRKIRALLECHALVRVIAPGPTPPNMQMFHEKNIELLERAYQPQDIAGAFLVVAATDNAGVNAQISQDCASRNILCNVVDQPELGNFYYASTYTCGDLKIAISTNGISPALARKIKTDLAERYADEFVPYLHYLQKMRQAVKEKIAEESTRETVLNKIARDAALLDRCKDERFCRKLMTLDYQKEVDKWL